MECPVCTEIPHPPIYSCINGHTSCNDCRPKLKQCALCNGEFTRVRNFAMENIVNCSTFKCKYTSEGCDKVLKGEKMLKHFEECDFRAVACMEKRTVKCQGELIPYSEFALHLEVHHKNSGNKDKQKEWFDFAEFIGSFEQDTTWPLYYKYYGDNLFFKHSRVEAGSIYWWVSIMGSAELAKKFNVTLTLKADGKEVPKLSWTIPVHSFRSNFTNVGKANCVCLASENLIPFCRFDERHPCDEVMYKFAWSIKFTIQHV